MKELLLPMLLDNGQSIRDGEEIGRLGAQARNLSRQLANQQASADSLREALTYSRQAAQAYSELAESYQEQRDDLQRRYDRLMEDPHGLRYWVQHNLDVMRGRLVRTMISKERLLAMKTEEGITATERREINKGLVAFAYVLWQGVTEPARIQEASYKRLDEMVKMLDAQIAADRNAVIRMMDIRRAVNHLYHDAMSAHYARLPSWPGLEVSGIDGTVELGTLRSRTLSAQSKLERDIEFEVVRFEDNGNRLVPGPNTSGRTRITTDAGDEEVYIVGSGAKIARMLDENWAFIMDKQFT